MLKSRCVSNSCPNRCTITCRTLYLTSSFNFYEGHAYSITIDKGSQTAFIDSSWTRGLAVHPVGEFFSRILRIPFLSSVDFFFRLRAATIATFFAFFFGLFATIPVMGIISSLVALLAAVLTLIAFALDIALFGLVDVEFNKLNADITTKTGPGSSPPFLFLRLFTLTQKIVIYSFPLRLSDRILVDLCHSYTSSHRYLRCMFRMLQGQEAH